MKKRIAAWFMVAFVITIFMVSTLPAMPFSSYSVGREYAMKAAEAEISFLEKSGEFSIRYSDVIKENGKTLFYIFHLQPQGYMVVTADKRLPPIIAYSFSSNFGEIGEENILLQILKEDVSLRLDNIARLPPQILKDRQSLWHSLLKDGKNFRASNFQQWPPEGSTSTEGWMETRWHQNSPYNNFCPMDKAEGKRSVAGCPAIAMAQILNYHQTTCNVSFNDSDDYYHNYEENKFWIDDDHEEYDFPSFPQLNSYLATLQSHYENGEELSDNDKAALVFACGVAAKQVYSYEVSGTFGVNQAYQAYLRFGIDGIKLLTENDENIYEELRKNIIEGYPAHLALVTPDWSAGHNVVVDGYNTNDFYHINFGWGGKQDGWYSLPDEMPYGLTVVEGVIVDILREHEGAEIYCYGNLRWNDVKMGEMVEGTFTVENAVDANSTLDWEIAEYPEWGTWSFNPSYGEGLKGGESIVVNV